MRLENAATTVPPTRSHRPSARSVVDDVDLLGMNARLAAEPDVAAALAVAPNSSASSIACVTPSIGASMPATRDTSTIGARIKQVVVARAEIGLEVERSEQQRLHAGRLRDRQRISTVRAPSRSAEKSACPGMVRRARATSSARSALGSSSPAPRALAQT